MPDAALSKPLRVLRALLFVVWLAGTAALVWVMLVFPNRVQQAPSRDVVLDPEPGQGLTRLAQRLAEAQVIDNPRAFIWYLRLLGVESRLRRGPVVINRALSVRDLLPRLVHDFGVSFVRVPIPEGFTSFDIAQRFSRYGVCDAPAFERAVFDSALLANLGIAAQSAEGYLFPATYDLRQESAAEDAVRAMVRIFRERTAAKFAAYEAAHDGLPFSLTPHELVTLASIVEREARAADERPTIAGVFMNRLTSPDFRPHRLQADPTVAYGCLIARDRVPSCRSFDGKRVTAAMVHDPENPYSTYRNDGLPPGPICNPGLSALSAALDPAQHDYFYFVTHGGGRHQFTRTLEEHNARVHGTP
jgi:UPF0755 protein